MKNFVMFPHKEGGGQRDFLGKGSEETFPKWGEYGTSEFNKQQTRRIGKKKGRRGRGNPPFHWKKR